MPDVWSDSMSSHENPAPSRPATPDPESIFHRARAIELADARAAFLHQACAGDAALRAKIDALLAADDRVGGFLATRPPGDAPTEPRAGDRVGTVIGPYKILQEIGVGGFGTVYLAEQTEPVRRKVAIKIIKAGMDTRQVVARFEAERQALALMDHPHIAHVLDGGATPVTDSGGGRPYFVMEYVVGDAITRFADAHRLSVHARLTLFQQVCSAVQHAHTKGIIHRDIKPGNVLVSMVDGKPFAKVIDFGIAKATAQPLTDKTLFTEHRQLIGTPEYMSPEQAEGSPDIDTRADVYALGVLLYELLTGSTPIESTRLRRAAYDEMRRLIREEEPLAPSVRISRSLDALAKTAAARQSEPAKLSASVRGELDWIVLKALEKERGRRYETPNALADDVRRHLAGEPVVAAPQSAVYRLKKFMRKNKSVVVTGSSLAAALIVGIAGTTAGLLMAQVERDRTLRANLQLAEEKDAAEWSAYTASLALAQAAIDAGDMTESRIILTRLTQSKEGWEGTFMRRWADSIIWTDWAFSSSLVFSTDGESLLRWSGGRELGEVTLVWEAASGLHQPVEQSLPRSDVTITFGPTGATSVVPVPLRRWDASRSREEWRLVRLLTGDYHSVAFSPDAKLVAWFGEDDGDQRVLQPGDPTSNRLKVAPVNAYGGPIRRLENGRYRQVNTVERTAPVILASSPKGPSGLAITAPDGTRRIVGGVDQTVRFYEAKDGKPTLPATTESPDGVYREVAVFRMPDAVTNLQMTGDGTRLVIHLADGSARVWDIRDPEERRKDLQAEWAERVPAGHYLDTLWNATNADGTLAIADEELRDAVVNDAGLTPLRRLVAAEMLEERLEDDRLAAAEAFSAIVKDQTDKAAVQAAAAAADLPARVKARVVKKAEGWAYSAPKRSDAERLAEESRLRRLAEADRVTGLWSTDGQYGAPELPSLEEFRSAFATREDLLGATHPKTLEAMEMVATLESERGEGVERFAELIARTSSTSARPTGLLISRYCLYASEAALSGEFGRAEAALAFIRDHVGALPDEDSLNFGNTLFATGRVGGSVRDVRPNLLAQVRDLTGVELRRRAWWEMFGRGDLTRSLAALGRADQLFIDVASSVENDQHNASATNPYTLIGLVLLRIRRDDVPAALNATIALSSLADRTAFGPSALAIVRHHLASSDPATLATAGEIDMKADPTLKAPLTADEHRQRAREALAKARALMAPAADGTPSPWADDEDAKALLAEAEALITQGTP
jgi:serine/threonine protein kinase